MHGAGNDFLLADGTGAPELERVLSSCGPAVCHRRLGVGADGILLVSEVGERRARVVYWNSDGSRAAFCANGSRCAARFAAVRWGWSELVLETDYADLPARVAGCRVTLELPPPEAVHAWQELAVGAELIRGRYLIVGVPHLVVPVDWSDFWERPLVPLAPALRGHPALAPGGANVTLVRAVAGKLEARSFERGVEAETLSCGSGIVAAALTALAEGWATSPVEVHTASGRVLQIEASGRPPSCPVRLTGPAEWIAEIELAPELLGS